MFAFDNVNQNLCEGAKSFGTYLRRKKILLRTFKDL